MDCGTDSKDLSSSTGSETCLRELYVSRRTKKTVKIVGVVLGALGIALIPISLLHAFVLYYLGVGILAFEAGLLWENEEQGAGEDTCLM